MANFTLKGDNNEPPADYALTAGGSTTAGFTIIVDAVKFPQPGQLEFALRNAAAQISRLSQAAYPPA